MILQTDENNVTWLKVGKQTWCAMYDVHDWKYWIRRFKTKGLRKIINDKIKHPTEFN